MWQIITSGKSATQFAKLNNYGMNIKIIGSEIGQASTLKMLRSSYTKGVSALFLNHFTLLIRWILTMNSLNVLN